MNYRRSMIKALILISTGAVGCGQSDVPAIDHVLALGEAIDRLEAETEAHAADLANAPDLASVLRIEEDHWELVDAMTASMMDITGDLSSCMDGLGHPMDTLGMREDVQHLRDECHRHMETARDVGDMAAAHGEEDAHKQAMTDLMDAMRSEQGRMQEHVGPYRCDH